MINPPSVYPESAPRSQARAILLWLLSNDQTPTEQRLAAGDALATLKAPLPVGAILAPLTEVPGSLDDARRLLQTAVTLETTTRARVTVSLAVAHLRRCTPPAP